MTSRITVAVAAVLLVGCGTRVDQVSVQRATPPPTPVATAAATIRPVDFQARIGFLASDALRGRDTPSQGLEAAAAYIASEFRAVGLRPAGDAGGYIQRYPYSIRTLVPAEVHLEIQSATASAPLQLGRDFYVLAGQPDGVDAEIVFTGRGLAAGDSLVRDRVALVDLSAMSGRTALNRLRQVATEAGARAVLGVLDPGIGPDAVQQEADGAAGVGRAGGPGATLYAVRPAALRPAFQQAGLDLDSLLGQVGAADFRPVLLTGATARLAAPVSQVDHRPPNVVGILDGSDPDLKDTYIVLSAHMDHIGIRPPNARGDSIANGADDDASGTSAILELAEAFASLDQRPPRSLIFLTVSGEEKGLLGSSYFADHPPVPVDRIVADINIDMIGRNWPDTVVAIGQSFSSLGPLALRIAAEHPELNMAVIDDIWPDERFFFRSDHFNFAAKEIPSLFFFSGVHEDYHQVTDEADRIDVEKTARIARLIFYLSHAIATNRDPPRWTQEGLRQIRELIAEGR